LDQLFRCHQYLKIFKELGMHLLLDHDEKCYLVFLLLDNGEGVLQEVELLVSAASTELGFDL
jgi:hypothetical protein